MLFLCRQAWQGGALTPNAPLTDPTPRPRARVSPASCWGVTYNRRGRPSPSRQAPPPAPVMPETLQVTTDPKPPTLGGSPINQGEEEVDPRVSAAAVAMEVADALPAQTSSSQPRPTAVSVSVSVRDNPVSTSAAQPASAVNPHGRVTLLPRSSSPPVTSTTPQGPLGPSVLTNPAAGQGQSGQPPDSRGRQLSPPHPTEAECRTHPQAAPTSAALASHTIKDAGTNSPQAPDETAHPTDSSDHVGQPPALEPPMAGPSHPTPSKAGQLEYNLSSAIGHQFDSILGCSPAGALAVRSTPGPVKLADRLINDSFDRLWQSHAGGDDAAASEDDRLTENRLQHEQVVLLPCETLAAIQDSGTSNQQQTQEQKKDDARVQSGNL